MDNEQRRHGYALPAFELQPGMNVFTLNFLDRGLEHDYRVAMHRQMLALARFTLVLAILLYALFGVLDLWIVTPGQLLYTWTVRGTVLLISAGLFVFSFYKAFTRHHEGIMVGFGLLLALGLTAILSVVSDAVIDRYYVAFLLIIMAAFSIFGLRFINGVLLSLGLIAIYLASELLFRDQLGVGLLSNMTFMFSALLIVGLGGYTAELQRRLAFYRRLLVEYERERSEHSALHDPLTGLPNRRLLLERIGHAMARDNRFQRSTAVLFIDLDDFKTVNDQHGHASGDELLREVADRLAGCIRAVDMVARMGGDEFVVLAEDVESPEAVDVVIARVQAALREPCHVEGVELSVQMSIGVALHPRDGSKPSELLDVADREMYRMKHSHGRRRE